MRTAPHFCAVLLSLALAVLLIPASDASLAAMSIDFGSQYIKIALVKPGVPMEIVLNKESRRKTPNLVTIRNGERLFGDPALALSIKQPSCAYSYLADLLGKKLDNPLVSLYRKRFPYVKIVGDDARGTIQFEVEDEQYSVETLVAMIISNARHIAEEFAEQPVKDVVITVPPFFNQAERRAMVSAAEIAGVNLLQLINDHSAAGLSYGIFRRKEITEQAQTLLIYDMGASKTTVSILEFRLQKEKKTNEKNPVMSTLGIGYDRTLGGLEISLRLRDHLINEYRKQYSYKEDIAKNARSMAKMLKEAERVKQVLSANADHYAQIENLHEEKDFRMYVTREQLEGLIKDLEPRVTQPITDALKMAELSVDQIDQIVLMGAGTRVPKIQSIIQQFFKGKELGKFLNTDEAIAMGAVYQAAHLSKGFKVKKFGVQDLQIFPIQVDFVSVTEKNGVLTERFVRRPIYGYKSFYPTTKKILSFTSHTKDFTFNVNYGELKQLSEKQLSEFGSLNISDILLSGVTDAVQAETSNEGTIFKGVKAHFNVDLSGIVHVDSAEVFVERPVKEESAFASIAEKITGLFSSGKKTEEVKDDEKKEEKEAEVVKEDKRDQSKEDDGDTQNGEQPSKKNGEPSKEADSSSAGSNADEKKGATNETDKNDIEKSSKPKVTKIPVKLERSELDVISLSSSEIHSSKKRLEKFEQMEKQKAEREAAHNNLEALVYDVADKLKQPEFQEFGTTEERDALQQELVRVRTWLEDDVGVETKTEEFTANHKAMQKLLRPISNRIKEHKERPLVVSDLLMLFNHSELFLSLGKNLTEAEIFTEIEISTLESVLNETKAWWAEKNASQAGLRPVDPPAYTVEDVKDKIRGLDREVKYLLNKMKYSKPKVKKEDAEGKNNTDSGNETTSSDGEKKDNGGVDSKRDVNENVAVEESVDNEKKKADDDKSNFEKPDESTHDDSEL